VFTVRTEVPEFTTDVGVNLELANLGSPVTEKLTVPANPCTAVMVTVYVAVPPLPIVALDGVAEIVKSAFPVTMSVTLTL